VVERVRQVWFGQARQPGNERQQRYYRRIVQLLRLVEAKFYCNATVIGALLFVVSGRLLAFRMLAAGEKLEARQDLQPAVETGRHP
jgi:hypothetical protein